MSANEFEGFEIFDRRGAPTQKEPFVTIQTRGLISFNKTAYQALGEVESIELLYNPTQRIMAIRPGSTKAPNSYPVRQQSNGGSYLIAGTAFTTHYRIDTSIARRYSVEIKGNALFVDLNQRSVEVIGARSQKRLKD